MTEIGFNLQGEQGVHNHQVSNPKCEHTQTTTSKQAVMIWIGAMWMRCKMTKLMGRARQCGGCFWFLAPHAMQHSAHHASYFVPWPRMVCTPYVIICIIFVAHRTCVMMCIILFGLWPRMVCNIQHASNGMQHHLFFRLVRYGGTWNMCCNLHHLFWVCSQCG